MYLGMKTHLRTLIWRLKCSDLFGLGRKIVQITMEKRWFNILDILDQILEELYDTNENTNESSSRIINPHLVRSKGRPRNKRFKSSVKTHKNFNKNGSSSIFIQDNNEQGDSQNNNKESKACSNCGSTNHNIRRCIAPCKSCKRDGHTYIKCKRKDVKK